MRRLTAALAVGLALIAAQAHAADHCSVPGAQALIASPATRFILVGEMHGAQQSPAEFADLVCALAQSGRKVVVGLEFRQAEQDRLDRFLASDGGIAATDAFLRGPHSNWTTPFKDGRTSIAMFGLIKRLRELKRAGQVEDVRFFVPDIDGDQAYERAMGANMAQIAEFYPGALVLILVGNDHARKAAMPVEFGGYKPAAMWLPPGATVALVQMNWDGQAWNCNTNLAKDCGPHDDPGDDSATWGVHLDPSDPPYDGVLASGVPATPSPPAVK